jgi:hypothetical protein
MSRASALSEDPMDLSHPQRMSKRILSHLLSELKSKLDKPIYRRFSAILNQSQRLEDLMYHCVRIDVLAFVDDGKLYDKRADRLQS